MSNYLKEEDIFNNYNQCVDQIEALERLIKSHSYIPPKCLGGEMYVTYQKVRKQQLNLIKEIYNQLTKQI